MPRHIPSIRRAAVHACSLNCIMMRGNSTAHPAQHQKRGQHFGGKCQRQQVQLLVQPAHQCQRYVHHYQQGYHRQGHTHSSCEQAGTQVDQGIRGGASENISAHRNIVEALCEQAQNFAVEPEREKQHAREKLRDHQEDSRIGLRVGVDGGSVGVPGLQAEDLRRDHKGFRSRWIPPRQWRCRSPLRRQSRQPCGW